MHTPETPALGKLKSEDNKSKATQDYRGKPCLKTKRATHKMRAAFYIKAPSWGELPRKTVSGQIWKLRLGDVNDLPAVPAGHLLTASSPVPPQVIKSLLFSTGHKTPNLYRGR